MLLDPAYYEPLGDGRYRSTRATVGPWSPHHQHGSPPAALLGGILAKHAARDGMRVARLSMDFFAPVPVTDLTVAASVVRPGAKVELVDASVKLPDDRVVLRASAWRLAAGAGRSPEVHVNEASPPLPSEPSPLTFLPGIEECPYAESLEWRFVEGGSTSLGPATVWTRAKVAIVRGEEVTPLQRVLAMVDSANGVSAELPFVEWTFVPVNLTVVVHRHPEGEWVGMSARTSVGDAGIGLSEARVFDTRGDVGRVVQTLYVARR